MPAETHGQSDTKLYKVWSSMKQRCRNPNDAAYHLYGGREVEVCREWDCFEPFYEWAIGAGYEEGLTLERVDPDGDYEPANCTWIPKPEQSANTRRCKFITFRGETKILKEWAEALDLPYHVLQSRITKYGWSVERAFTTPVKPANRRHVQLIQHGGERKSIAEWARALGISYGSLYGRLYRGATLPEVIDEIRGSS